MALDFNDLFGSKARDEITRLNKELEQLGQQLFTITKEKEVQEKSYQAYIASINKSDKSKEEHDAVATGFDENKKRLTVQIAAYETSIKSLEQQVAELDGKSASLTQAISNHEKQKKTLSIDVERLSTQHKELSSTIDDKQTTRQQLTQDVQRLRSVQTAITNGTACLQDAVSRINRHSEPEQIFSVLEYELLRLVEHDRESGAMQCNVEMKPLCLVVDVGLNSTALALVRLTQNSAGEVRCTVEAKQILTQGVQQAEELLTEWVTSRFAAAHPRWCSGDTAAQQFSSIARRLLTLLIMNAPYGEREESVVIDSQQLHALLPCTQDEMVPLFMPVTGPKGELMARITAFLQKKTISATDLDRIVCLGMYANFPLLQDSLREVFGRVVIVGDAVISTGEKPVPVEVTVSRFDIKTVTQLANSKGITTSARQSVRDIIHEIQRNEGYQPCFATGYYSACVHHFNCLWNAECKEQSMMAPAKVAVAVISSDLKLATREQQELERWKSEERIKIEREIKRQVAKQEDQRRQLQIRKEPEQQPQFQEKSANTAAKSNSKCSITGMEFVFVKGGTFQMGDTFGNGGSDEKPVHEVTLSDFYIGKYQVTQAEWQKVMGNNPSSFKGDRNPVEQVSWDDTQEFIKKLNQQSGKKHRLLTEAEWEYAARSGGKSENYAGGNNVDAVAWYSGISGAKTHPVGQKQANGLEIYDMSGNVWEWCQDWYSNYCSGNKRNHQGPLSGSDRVYRGGSWISPKGSARAAYRDRNSTGLRTYALGFRLALSKE